ncbi:MAG TPA: nitroreductase [Rhizomicrobium sp.]|nr:nitroreductase [Rhizomicrobium sp.]
MELRTAIRLRRAVRDYSQTPVSAALLRDLISAASWAPSAMNEQPWHFTVVTDAALLDEISQRSKEWMLKEIATMPRPRHFRDLLADPAFHIFYHAPALIVISVPGEGQWRAEDCALAAQNMMLTALEQKLGSCWIGFAQGWLNTEAGLNLLGLPRQSRVVAPIIVGYPKASPPPVPRKPPLITWIGKIAAPPEPAPHPDASNGTLMHP